VTTLTTLATEVRANRIVAGVRIPHPVSDPTVAPDKEIEVRIAVARRALDVLALAVEGPTVFAVDRVAAG
jgi:glycine/betaine/sarcosine/D-proline reductase family selenoprotein B